MKKIISLLLVLVIATHSIAQVDTAKEASAAPSHSTTFTYYVDGYYKGDFAGKTENNKTSFTNSSNTFQIGMASVKLDQVLGNFAATLDLGVGKRAEEFSYNDNGVATSFKQAFISYAPNSTVKFTAGKWATHVGYELL
ncbi:MAG: outer membrane beta-barrel protein, partial [Flavobacterium sp.]